MEVAWSNISHVHLRKAWLPALWLASRRNHVCVWTGRSRLPFSPLTRGFTKLQSLVYINVVSIMYVQAEKGVMNAEPAKSWLCHSWEIHHRPSAVSSICLLSNEVAWALMTWCLYSTKGNVREKTKAGLWPWRFSLGTTCFSTNLKQMSCLKAEDVQKEAVVPMHYYLKNSKEIHATSKCP